MSEPSQHMIEAFGLGVGSPAIECVCGRTHCAPESDCIDSDESEEMRINASLKPKQFILHENVDAISAKMINGATAVVECECNYLARLESILWNERERILRYYKLRRDADAAELAAFDKAMNA